MIGYYKKNENNNHNIVIDYIPILFKWKIKIINSIVYFFTQDIYLAKITDFKQYIQTFL